MQYQFHGVKGQALKELIPVSSYVNWLIIILNVENNEAKSLIDTGQLLLKISSFWKELNKE